MKHIILAAGLVVVLLFPTVSFGRDGKCLEGDCENGQGTWKFLNGTMFVGGWKGGKRHGQVTLIYPNGDEEVREYKNGIRQGRCLEGNCEQGEGLIMYSDESVFVGQFRAGQRYGVGKWSHPGGFKYEGQWKDDKI